MIALFLDHSSEIHKWFHIAILVTYISITYFVHIFTLTEKYTMKSQCSICIYAAHTNT